MDNEKNSNRVSLEDIKRDIQDSYLAYKNLPYNLRDNKEIARLAVESDWMAYKHLPYRLQYDNELIMSAVNQNGRIGKYIPDSKFKEKSIRKALKRNGPPVIGFLTVKDIKMASREYVGGVNAMSEAKTIYDFKRAGKKMLNGVKDLVIADIKIPYDLISDSIPTPTKFKNMFIDKPSIRDNLLTSDNLNFIRDKIKPDNIDKLYRDKYQEANIDENSMNIDQGNDIRSYKKLTIQKYFDKAKTLETMIKAADEKKIQKGTVNQFKDKNKDGPIL